MERSLFFDGQDVQEEDVTNVEDTVEAEVTRRIVDIAANTGIIKIPDLSPESLSLSQTNPYTLIVSPGTAYSSDGQWIRVNTPTNYVFAASDVGKYVCITYAYVDSDPVEHPITGVPYNTRRLDSFTILTVSVPSSTQVPLGLITAVDLGGIATIDSTVREYWGALLAPGTVEDIALDPNGEVITHVRARGTGTFSSHNPHALSPADIGFVADPTAFLHQALDHVSGIEVGSTSTCAQVTVDSVAVPNSLDIQQLVAPDQVLINGIRLTGGQQLIAPLSFDFAAEPSNPGLYEVLLDTTATVTKSVRAQYQAPKAVFGVQVVDVSPNHAIANYVLNWNSGQKKLSWNSGIAVPVNQPSADPSGFTGDQFYTLYRAAPNDDQYITVWVDFSALDAIGTDVSDTVGINATALTSTKLLLATVPWSGLTYGGFLGYGDQGAAGTAYDKRQHGNLSVDNIADAFYELEFRTRMAETRSNGWVKNISTGQLSGAQGSTVGLNVVMGSGPVYVRGKRFYMKTTTVTLPDNETVWVVVDDTGAVQTLRDDPAVLDPIQPPIYFAYWFKFVTSGGAVTTSTDQRIDISDPDTGNVKTNRTNTFIKPQVFNGDVTDDSAALETLQAPGASSRKLLWHSVAKPGGSSFDIRIYAGGTGAFEFVVNAVWNPGLATWSKDRTGTAASKWVFNSVSFTGSEHLAASNTPWADGLWDRTNALVIDLSAFSFSWTGPMTVTQLFTALANMNVTGTINGGALNISGGGTITGAAFVGSLFVNGVSTFNGTATGNGTIGAVTLTARAGKIKLDSSLYSWNSFSYAPDYGPHVLLSPGGLYAHQVYFGLRLQAAGAASLGASAPFRAGISPGTFNSVTVVAHISTNVSGSPVFPGTGDLSTTPFGVMVYFLAAGAGLTECTGYVNIN